MVRKNQDLSSDFSPRYHMPNTYNNPILVSMVDLLRPYRNKVIVSAKDGITYEVKARCSRDEFIGEFINQEEGADIILECYYIEEKEGEPVYDLYLNDELIGEDFTSKDVYYAFCKIVDPILGMGLSI